MTTSCTIDDDAPTMTARRSFDMEMTDDEEVVGLLSTPSTPTQRRRCSLLALGSVVAFGLVVLIVDRNASSSSYTKVSWDTSTMSFHRPNDDSTETAVGGSPVSTSTRTGSSNKPVFDFDFDAMDEASLLQHYQQRLQPRRLRMHNTTTLAPHQFLHLHHMKTGGTSLDGLIQCGLRRLTSDTGSSATKLSAPYANLHECSQGYYERCTYGDDPACRQKIGHSSILSYCAPLQDIPRFTWDDTVSAVTVLRHPVDRVWSMFRFQTKACYQCKPLLDIYRDIEAVLSGADPNATAYLRPICHDQLLNHQTRNVLRQAPEGNIPTTEAHAAEAMHNLQSFFTLVGVTEDMPTTAAMVAHVFPWLNATIADWADVLDIDANTKDRTNPPFSSCTIGHKNASPKNNRCGPDKTHWDLPAHPDPETAAMILKHNPLDLQLYEKGLEVFALQRRALGMDD